MNISNVIQQNKRHHAKQANVVKVSLHMNVQDVC